MYYHVPHEKLCSCQLNIVDGPLLDETLISIDAVPLQFAHNPLHLDLNLNSFLENILVKIYTSVYL